MLNQFKAKYGRWIALFLFPCLAWVALFFSRPYTYSLWCAHEPTPCVVASINSIDQLAFSYRSIVADYYSTVAQYVVGVIAFLFPWLLLFIRRKTPATTLPVEALPVVALKDTGLLIASILWNGFIREGAHLLAQRPRPMVFDSPLIEGLNPLQYTSFYSGHTSFVALASLNIYFMVKRKYEPSLFWIPAAFSFLIFSTTLTGILRVTGGRHFPSDVVFGAFAGFIIAGIINQRKILN